MSQVLQASLDAANDLPLLLHTLYQLYEHSRMQRQDLERELAELYRTCSQLREALEQERLATARATRDLAELHEATQFHAALAEQLHRSRADPSPGAASPNAVRQAVPTPPRITEETSRHESEGAAPAPPTSAEEGPEPIPFPQRAPSSAASAPTSAGPTEAAERGGVNELVVLRVPNIKTAQRLHQAITALPGVATCTLREFERGRILFHVTARDGTSLQEQLRHLSMVDLRSVKLDRGAIVLQCL